MIEGGINIYAREQSAARTPIKQPRPVAVCVCPESDLRKSEFFFLSLLGDEVALK